MSQAKSAKFLAFPLNGLSYIKGEHVDLAAVRGKNVVVVELWATWCPPCRVSIPHLTAIQKKYQAQGLIVVGITNESEEEATPFVNKMGNSMDYRVAVDTKGTLSQQYASAVRSRGIPTAIIVTADGFIGFHGHPMDPAFEKAIAEELAKLNSQ